MSRNSKYVMLLLAAGLLAGCSEKKDDSSRKEGVETVLPSQANEVKVMTLEKTAFSKHSINYKF